MIKFEIVLFVSSKLYVIHFVGLIAEAAAANQLLLMLDPYVFVVCSSSVQ